MSALVRPDIIAAIRADDIEIWKQPCPDRATRCVPEDLVIGPNSIDLHLHRHLRVYTNPALDRPGVVVDPSSFALDSREENPTKDLFIPEEGLVLQPNVGYLARTVERTYTPKHVPKIGGRSSTGRLFLNIHQTAGFGDVGFDGTWTLELSVVHPVKVYPNQRIAQLWLFTTSSDLGEHDKYRGRYQGQVDPTAYRGHQ